MMRRPWIVAAAGLAFLAGCSWSDVIIGEIKSLPPNTSFGYSDGYEAGCKAAISRVGAFGFDRPSAARDETRARAEADYAKGWDDASRRCETTYAGRHPRYVAPAQWNGWGPRGG